MARRCIVQSPWHPPNWTEWRLHRPALAADHAAMGQWRPLDAPRRYPDGDDWDLIRTHLVMPFLFGLSSERLLVAGFDRRGCLLHFDDSEGQEDSHSGLLPALRRTLAPALVTSVLIAHNHPAGDAVASVADRHATRHAAALCRLAGVILLDHWILAGEIVIRLCDTDPDPTHSVMSIDACQHPVTTL